MILIPVKQELKKSIFCLFTGGNVTAAFLAQRSSEPTGPLVCLLICILISFLILVVNNRGVDNSGQFLRNVYKCVISKSVRKAERRSFCMCLSNPQ